MTETPSDPPPGRGGSNWDAIAAEIGWDLGPGLRDYRARVEDDEDPWIPVLMQIPRGSLREFARGDGPWRGLVRIPALYTEVLPRLDRSFEDIEYVTASVRRAFFEVLERERAGPLADAVLDLAISPPLPRARSSPAAAPAPTRPTGPGAPGTVVVGVIDDGIALAHERFRDAGGTRIEFAWVQDGVPPGPSEIFGPGAEGREYRKLSVGAQPGLDAMLAASTHAGIVDEDGFYRRAGLTGPSSPPGHKAIDWRRAHGTHVLDLAANGPASSHRDGRLIAVQLPITTTGMPVSSNLGRYVVEGIWYILLRSLSVAERLGCGPLPVVINLSYGITSGPHDGLHLVERAIDEILPLWREAFGVQAEIAIGAGNSYLDRLHAEVRFDAVGGVVDVPWRAQPDDRTPSVVDVWLPPTAGTVSDRVTLTLIAPDGAGSVTLGEEFGAVGLAPEIGTIAEVRYARLNWADGRARYRITIQPTFRVDGDGPVAPHGLWTIRLENRAFAPTDVLHARIRRDEAPYGYPMRGRQTYFDDPLYERHDAAGRPEEADGDSIVKRFDSINAMATGAVPLVVGGFLRRELRPAPYSAAGPLVRKGEASPLHHAGPDVLCVSEDSLVHGGVLAAGTRSGSTVAMNGTSVAAPQVANWVADRMAGGQAGDRQALTQLAESQEGERPPPAPPKSIAPRGGAGRVALPSGRFAGGARRLSLE